MAKCTVFYNYYSRDLWQNARINIHLQTETTVVYKHSPVVFRHEIKEAIAQTPGARTRLDLEFGNGKKENH